GVPPFLESLHWLNLLVKLRSIGKPHHIPYGLDEICPSSKFTSASCKYFVIKTQTPYSLLISTLSITAFLKNNPNPPSLRVSIDSSHSSAPMSHFTSFISKLL